MCGIAGFLSSKCGDEPQVRRTLSAMTGALSHRGPDGDGQWLDVEAGVAMGHRRLAVIDLSAAGQQPMVSSGGRYVLVFNGEIYNHLELRERLPRSNWRGHSDTETLLAAIESWGLDRALRASIGMFALALWDRAARTLCLARDRLGEKPLYYGRQGSTLLFASELKALQRHPDFRGTIDRVSVAEYVRCGYVPTPRSIFSDIKKLMPGTILTVEPGTSPVDETAPKPFWSLHDVIASREETLFRGTPADAVAELETLLFAAVKGQRLSDVPLGAFLSGGVDSSTIVAIMQAATTLPAKTFTIGFEEDAYNEAAHARAVANHLSTDHTELYVSAKTAMEVIPELPLIYDEPFADPSQIPTVLLSRLARQQVTVALSGDAGDELFCGYSRYPQTLRVWDRLSRVPKPARSLLHSILPTSALQEGIGVKDVDDLYEFTNKQWKGHPLLVRGIEQPRAGSRPSPQCLPDPRERMMYADTMRYLPDDILVKVDRAAMSVGLETRVPLLDHRIVEFAWRLPIGWKHYDGVGKWPLKQILYKHVPERLVNRPKMGFGVPLEHWLRGSLREWADDLLSMPRLRSEGILDAPAIAAEWATHRSGKRNRHYGLWTVLMFEAWYAGQRGQSGLAA
jgi:asparagine synthase (glutamine-hydrolysing)